jgi:putative protein-disulfide isomerase
VKLVIANDPLCGWCFGTVPAVRTLVEQLPTGWTIEVACGGLVSGERVRPVALDANYLRAGLEKVADVTGRRAGAAFEDLLVDGRYVSDSEPPTRALWVATQLDPTHRHVLEMAHHLSDAFYVSGQPLDDERTIAAAAERAGLDAATLVARWRTDEARTGVRQWWTATRQRGITTYPSLFVEERGTLLPLAAGAFDATEVLAALREVNAA